MWKWWWDGYTTAPTEAVTEAVGESPMWNKGYTFYNSILLCWKLWKLGINNRHFQGITDNIILRHKFFVMVENVCHGVLLHSIHMVFNEQPQLLWLHTTFPSNFKRFLSSSADVKKLFQHIETNESNYNDYITIMAWLSLKHSFLCLQ